MAQYKKRHVNRFRSAPRPKKVKHTAIEDNDISMSPSGRKQSAVKAQKQDMRVLKGKKIERQRKTKAVFVTAVIVAATCLILHYVLPMGILENLQNLTSIIGTGSYPTELHSSNTIAAVSKGNYYYVLTDTKINAYSNAGKEIFSNSHGFENPVIKTSKTRAMVFSQGGEDLLIYNLNSLKYSFKSEEEIITANISNSGAFAIATRTDSYASVVTVYNKNGKQLYKWYSAEDTVNNIAVSPNGKKIAVSLFNATTGAYNSKVSILNFDSATPEYTNEYKGKLIYNLDTAHNNGFTVITSNTIDFIKWSKHKKTDYKNDYSTALFNSGANGSVAVFNRESDKTDNKIAVFSKNGLVKKEFGFKGVINDITISGGNVYLISDTKVYILSADGEVLRTAECGFGVNKLSVIGTNTVAAITDNKIEEIKLEQ